MCTSAAYVSIRGRYEEVQDDPWCEDECNDYGGALGVCNWQLLTGFLVGYCECWI